MIVLYGYLFSIIRYNAIFHTIVLVRLPSSTFAPSITFNLYYYITYRICCPPSGCLSSKLHQTHSKGLSIMAPMLGGKTDRD